MRKLIFILFILAPLSLFAQSSDYKVSSYLTEGTKAPNTHYTGGYQSPSLVAWNLEKFRSPVAVQFLLENLLMKHSFEVRSESA